jgi:hypothetical protein
LYEYLVGERETTHTGLDAEDVVVHGEHVKVRRDGTGLGLDRDLSVIDAREVARAGRLVLLGLEREGVRVHTGHGGASVVLEGLDGVEVLAGLLLEAVLTVEHKLEGVDGAGSLLSPGSHTLSHDKLGSTGKGGGRDGRQTSRERSASVGGDEDIGGGEVPKVGHGHGTTVGAEDELLDGVVVGETDLLGLTSGSHGIGAGVLDLLDEVLVTLLGEAATLLGVEVDVVGVHLEGGAVGVVIELGGEVEVEADLVVLEGDERKGETRVTVEEENQRKEHLTGVDRGGGHLTPSGLLGLIEVKLGVQTPPALVVLVDALTTNGKLNILDGTLGGPAVIESTRSGGSLDNRGLSLELDVHVGNEITVTGDRHGNAAGVGGSTVHGLLDVLHSEVSVALVNRLEESNLGVTSEVDILSTIGNELH